MTHFRRALQRAAALAVPLTLTAGLIGVPSALAAIAPGQDPGPGTDLSATTDALQADLSQIQAQRNEAEDAYREASRKARELRAEVAANQSAADKARAIVGQYARTIYMSGPTDLSVLASMIDTDRPGDIVSAADEALRVGDHKDDQYDRAQEILRRNEEMMAAADSAEQAAAASLQSIDNQLNGVRRQMADGVDAWAKHLAGETTLFSAEQARANSEAAAGWARYLSLLADWRVPTFSTGDLASRTLSKGLTQPRDNPGVATFTHDGQKSVVLPDRVVAMVTYAVSKLGTPYKWHSNTEDALDCSSLVDRSWNVPAIPRDDRTDARRLVPDGVAGLAKSTRLIPASKLAPGDVVFMGHKNRGLDHVGVVLRPGLMIAADGNTGGVNAVEIPKDTVWHVGRPSLQAPTKPNVLPKATKKPFECGADPRGFVRLPDGKVLANPDSCPPSPAFGEANMQPVAIRGGRCAAAIWPQITTIGGWRPSDPFPDHPSGRAIDVMMPGGCSEDAANVALGTSIATFFMNNAGKFNVQYVIWHQRIWNAASEAPKPPATWRGMSDRGNCTANHMDHVHVSFIGPNTNPQPPAPADPAPADPAQAQPPANDGADSTEVGSGAAGKSTKPTKSGQSTATADSGGGTGSSTTKTGSGSAGSGSAGSGSAGSGSAGSGSAGSGSAGSGSAAQKAGGTGSKQ